MTAHGGVTSINAQKLRLERGATIILCRWSATSRIEFVADMQIFITGANGFIGGAVASALVTDGHAVRGLVRSKAKADAVAACGVEAVVGSLDDAALLQAEARAADAVVNAASSDHRGAVER